MAAAKKTKVEEVTESVPARRPRNLGKELTAYTDDALRFAYGGTVTNPDRTLEANSTEGIKLYTEMCRKDEQLGLCFRKRAGNVIAQGWDILPGGDTTRHVEIAEFITDVFNDIENLDVARQAAFMGIAWGFRPMEIMFKPRADNRIGVDCIKDRDPARFAFNKDNQLVYTGSGGFETQIMPTEKFLVNSWGSTESPYGQGLCRELYGKWLQKSVTNKISCRYVEKLGTAFMVATYPPGATPDAQDELYAALELIHSNNIAIMPEGFELEFKEANHQGVVLLFQFILDHVNDQYAKAILGQVLSTENEEGTHALAKFQSKGEQRVVEEDSKWQMEQFDDIVHFLVDINFGAQPADEYPKFSIPFEESKDIVTLAQGYKELVSMGVPIPLDYVMEQLGIPEAEEGAELLVAPQPQGLLGSGGIEDADFDDVTPADKKEAAAALSELDKIYKFNESLKKKPSARRKAIGSTKRQRT